MNYGPFAVTHCQKCSNELTYAEYRAKAWYCEPCRKARADDKHRDQLADQINKANRRA